MVQAEWVSVPFEGMWAVEGSELGVSHLEGVVRGEARAPLRAWAGLLKPRRELRKV